MSHRFIILLGLLLLPALLQAKLPEKYYADKWCTEHNGITEVRLEDNTRVDCLTAKYAVEVDFAKNWAQAIGQSLHYATVKRKKPGVVLILSSKKDERFVDRIRAQGIKTWVRFEEAETPQKTETQYKVVKKSRADICHDYRSRSYRQTKHFTRFPTLKACLQSGGRLPRR